MFKKSAGEGTAGIAETSMALSPHVHRARQDHAVKARVEVFSQEPGTLKLILCLLVRPWEISAPQVVIEMDQKTERECVVEIKKEKR